LLKLVFNQISRVSAGHATSTIDSESGRVSLNLSSSEADDLKEDSRAKYGWITVSIQQIFSSKEGVR